MEYWLGIDCGGTFIKAGLYDRDGNECRIVRQNLAIISPQPGWAERDMTVLWQAMSSVIRQLLASHPVPPVTFRALVFQLKVKVCFCLISKENHWAMPYCPLTNGRCHWLNSGSEMAYRKCSTRSPAKRCGPGTRYPCCVG